MPPATLPEGPPFEVYRVFYPMYVQSNQAHNAWVGWTTDRFYRDLCISLNLPVSDLSFSLGSLDHLYARKRSLVVDMDPESRDEPHEFDTSELASWWVDPSRLKIDRYGQTPGSSIQLGLYIAILSKLKTQVLTSLTEGENMTKEQVDNLEEDLDKTLREDEALKDSKLTVASITQMLIAHEPIPKQEAASEEE
ncbi:hypothetical protein BKA66DRAFT_570603 [Pyrenochaeta sp. MPI-SDFR-AT-0127]|nr:hypothetical protein BKA66DRAFT_570603 [Pyrenochaeta sp. MPI-SDFR-AT-0127]